VSVRWECKRSEVEVVNIGCAARACVIVHTWCCLSAVSERSYTVLSDPRADVKLPPSPQCSCCCGEEGRASLPPPPPPPPPFSADPPKNEVERVCASTSASTVPSMPLPRLPALASESPPILLPSPPPPPSMLTRIFTRFFKSSKICVYAVTAISGIGDREGRA
jgi:hypothetical protein